MKTEPEWKENLGYCPEEIKGHDVEVMFNDGSKDRDEDPQGWAWSKKHNYPIISFRDWTVWEEQQETKEPTPSWNGEGLPPVGTICLAKLRSGNWYKVRILLTNPEICSCIAVLIRSDGKYDAVHWLQSFKLLPREEDQAVHYMLEKVSDCDNSEEICRALYRAGYRKQ
jgi:hypothetical protein